VAPRPGSGYRRDRVTWVVFAALLSFGVLNAGLGASLPYLRASEHLSYVAGVLHQVAFAIGGGLAGVLAARAPGRPPRATAIRLGLAGAALAWLLVGYGRVLPVTAGAAFLVSLLATSALIRLWAVLADEHRARRTVAMTEGEVTVSLGSILAPLLLAALAASALGWRSAFVAGAAITLAAVLACGLVSMPAPVPRPEPAAGEADRPRSRRPAPTLVLVMAIVALEFSLTFWLASYLADDVGIARRFAVTMVGLLYAANLAGRLLASRAARRWSAEAVLTGAIAVALCGLPVLLAASGAAAAAAGLALAGLGIGAMFPLGSSLHVGASGRDADSALGQVLAAAAIGQVAGPLAVAAVAQAADLRTGLVLMPAMALAAGAALARHAVAGDASRPA
jgi:fucose permease